jgi:hypothetical protein
MKNQNNIAFKAWAVVVQGMEEGKQTLLLTKEGVKEEGGRFVAEQAEFLLYPTRGFDASDIKPDWKPRLARIEKAAGDPKHVPFRIYGLAEEVVKVTDPEAAKQLVPFTVLSEGAVERRFKEGGWEGLYCVLVRAYTLAMPMDLTRKEAYEKSPSWVNLETSIYTVGSTPVLPDEVWPFTKNKILKLIQP